MTGDIKGYMGVKCDDFESIEMLCKYLDDLDLLDKSADKLKESSNGIYIIPIYANEVPIHWEPATKDSPEIYDFKGISDEDFLQLITDFLVRRPDINVLNIVYESDPFFKFSYDKDYPSRDKYRLIAHIGDAQICLNNGTCQSVWDTVGSSFEIGKESPFVIDFFEEYEEIKTIEKENKPKDKTNIRE